MARTRNKGNTLGFALVVMSFLLSTAVSLASLHVMGQNNQREMNKVLATQAYDLISSNIAEPITIARTMASDQYLHDELRREREAGYEAVEEDLSRYLTRLEQGLGCHGAFVISDASLRYYTNQGFSRFVRPEREHDEWYRELMGSSERYDLDVDNDEIDAENLTVYVNAKVDDTDGTTLGLCGVGVRMTGIQELFRVLEQDFGVKICLVNPYGVVQVATDKASIERANLSGLINEVHGDDYEYLELGGGRFAVVKYLDKLDWYLVVQSGQTKEAAQFVNIILLNGLLCAVVLVVLFIALGHAKRHRDELAAASYVDTLTGLHNRRGYEEDRLALLEGPKAEDLVCVSIDVNGLKTVNDSQGHEAGDELIAGAAACLVQCFGSFGEVYRIGGDEFAALLHLAEGRPAELEEQVAAACAAWRGTRVERLSMSCGFAAQREFPDEDVLGLCRIADQRMYEAKDRYYERNGIKRRAT